MKPKVKSVTSQKANIRSKAKDREPTLAEAFDEPTRPPSDTIEQIRLEQLKGANLDKQLELAKIKAELARMQVDSGHPLGASPLLGSSTPNTSSKQQVQVGLSVWKILLQCPPSASFAQ